MTTVRANEAIACALEASAHRSQERGGHASAASAFERAAELSEAEGSRGVRLPWRPRQQVWQDRSIALVA